MGSNGWQGKGDPLEDAIERWLQRNNIRYRRADDMKTRLDFFLPDFNVYIEAKRFDTPRTNEQMQRASDVIVVQGMASMRFLERMFSDGQANETTQASARTGSTNLRGESGSTTPRENGSHGPHLGEAQPRKDGALPAHISEPAVANENLKRDRGVQESNG